MYLTRDASSSGVGPEVIEVILEAGAEAEYVEVDPAAERSNPVEDQGKPRCILPMFLKSFLLSQVVRLWLCIK